METTFSISADVNIQQTRETLDAIGRTHPTLKSAIAAACEAAKRTGISMTIFQSGEEDGDVITVGAWRVSMDGKAQEIQRPESHFGRDGQQLPYTTS